MERNELLLSRLDVLWKEHPEWTLGKLISIIVSMEHLEPRLVYLSDEEFFKRCVFLSKHSNLFKIKKLPAQSNYRAAELIANINDFKVHVEDLKQMCNKDSKYEQIIAYASLVDDLKYMSEYLVEICEGR